MKQTVTVAKATQSAVPELGKKETTLYYLIIGEDANKVVINIGEKTYNSIKALEEPYKANESIATTSLRMKK